MVPLCLQIFTQSAFYDVDATSVKKKRSVKRNLENVSLVTTTSRKQHAVFGKVIICPCYCIVFESGLMFDNLKSAYRVHGVEGIQNLLTEKRDNGGTRVTKNAAVIDKIVQYFT
jgi:hypothetical protein